MRSLFILPGCFVVVSNSQSDKSHVIFLGPVTQSKDISEVSSLKIHFVTHVQSSFCEVSLHLFTESIE